MWSAGDPLGRPLVLPRPVIKAHRKLQQPNLGRMTKGRDPSGMTVWVTLLQEKNQDRLRCLLKVEEMQSGLWRKVVWNCVTSHKDTDHNN